jgi:CheY-like chemotaxis protein
MYAKIKVLAVTRDPVLVSFLQKEIKDSQYEISNTSNHGAQLKEVLDRENPDFIIIDIVMPSLDGIGMCLQLRQWTQTPSSCSAPGAPATARSGARPQLGKLPHQTFRRHGPEKRISDTLKQDEIASILPNAR